MTNSAVQQSIAAAAAAAASLDAAHGGGADDERLSDDAVGRPPGICHANRPPLCPPPHRRAIARAVPPRNEFSMTVTRRCHINTGRRRQRSPRPRTHNYTHRPGEPTSRNLYGP